MLVLSRKQNQTIVINGTIEIQVLKIKGNTVRLGIQAPSNIKVLRGELSPFESEIRVNETVAEASTEYVVGELERLPNPFAVAHAN
jgi:carbon storage regulator